MADKMLLATGGVMCATAAAAVAGAACCMATSEPPTVTGFISKKQTGTFMGMWQKRWFVLQGQEIRYYKHTVGPDVQNVSDKQHIILGQFNVGLRQSNFILA